MSNSASKQIPPSPSYPQVDADSIAPSLDAVAEVALGVARSPTALEHQRRSSKWLEAIRPVNPEVVLEGVLAPDGVCDVAGVGHGALQHLLRGDVRRRHI